MAHNPRRELIPFLSNSTVKPRTAFLCILFVDASSASGAANNSSQVCFISLLFKYLNTPFPLVIYSCEPLVGKPLIITQVLDPAIVLKAKCHPKGGLTKQNMTQVVPCYPRFVTLLARNTWETLYCLWKGGLITSSVWDRESQVSSKFWILIT